MLEIVVHAVAQPPTTGGRETWPERLSPAAKATISKGLVRAHQDGSFIAAARELATVASLVEHGLSRPRLAEALLALVSEVAAVRGPPRARARPKRREDVTGGARRLRAPKVGEQAPANSMKAGRLTRTLRM